MADIQTLIRANNQRWADAKLTRDFKLVAARLTNNKDRYKFIESRTGVPWAIIAVIHEREASGDFTRSIAQGDKWNMQSVHVPRGRGPFSSFEEAAVDALVNCAPYAARWKDWSPGGALTLLEQYNGLGYANRGLPSPYIWSGTDQYIKGKYIADGKFDPDAVDKQLGCAGLLKEMGAFDEHPSANKHVAAGAIIVAGGAVAQTALKHDNSGYVVGGIAVGALIIAALVWYLMHKRGQ